REVPTFAAAGVHTEPSFETISLSIQTPLQLRTTCRGHVTEFTSQIFPFAKLTLPRARHWIASTTDWQSSLTDDHFRIRALRYRLKTAIGALVAMHRLTVNGLVGRN